MSADQIQALLGKLVQEGQKYEDSVPNSLSFDQQVLKNVDDKVLPFLLSEMQIRTLFMKDTNGANRQRFVDSLALLADRFKTDFNKTKEGLIAIFATTRDGFTNIVKNIPANDKTSAQRMETAMKNIEQFSPLVKNLNFAAMKADIEKKLQEKPKPVEADKPTLLQASVAAAMDAALKSGAITDQKAVDTVLALFKPAATTDTTLVTATANDKPKSDFVVATPADKIAADASTKKPDTGIGSATSASSGAATEPSEEKKARAAAREVSHTAAKTAPGVAAAAAAAANAQPPTTQQTPAPAAAPPLTNEQIILIVIAALIVLVIIAVIIYFVTKKSDASNVTETTPGMSASLPPPLLQAQPQQ